MVKMSATFYKNQEIPANFTINGYADGSVWCGSTKQLYIPQ